ncbi:N(2)-fixation sustaining protein CowN [Psychromonas sp.]|uniref:N(2)-fixation sustaining protein CowN n=1 Tax=Psychromonas sp. TaxID=1884585 RepID=UPI003568AED8
MSENNHAADRYKTFCGIDCDVIAMLEENVKAGNGDQRWHAYFAQKRAQQEKLQHDNLNFIGHQTNTLYEYFELRGDQAAK